MHWGLVASLAFLTKLSLHCCRITDEHITYLGSLTALRDLDLSGCQNLMGFGVRALEPLTTLTRLEMFNCSKATDEGIACLGYLTTLKYLDLSKCVKTTDVGVIELASLMSVTKLSLRYCNGITDMGIALLGVVDYLEGSQFRWLSKCDRSWSERDGIIDSTHKT